MGKDGILLINLGTPDAPEGRAVRRYLREFLGDPRVLDLPAPARWLLLHGIILPFRPRRSARAYASIWTEAGSPLLVHGRALRSALAERLGPGFQVELAMRYGEPSLEAGLAHLRAAGVTRIVAAPLFPQYAESTAGSVVERLTSLAAARSDTPPLQVLPPFATEAPFVQALARAIGPALAAFGADHLLMSFHGLPERHVRRADASGRHCLQAADCCENAGPEQARCYRAQCFGTARALAAELDGPPHTVSFQSRLGRTPWIGPHTEEVLVTLRERGVRRLAVVCPSFVADCLETLEEIGLRLRGRWSELGGEEFALLPALNAHPAWVEGLSTLLLGVTRTPAAGVRTR